MLVPSYFLPFRRSPCLSWRRQILSKIYSPVSFPSFLLRVYPCSVLFWCLLVRIYRDDRNKGTKRTAVKEQRRRTECERDIVVYRLRAELAVDVSRWILSFASNDPSDDVRVRLHLCIRVCMYPYVFTCVATRLSSEAYYILRKSRSSTRAVNWFSSLSCPAAFRELEIVRRQREVHCLRSIVSLRLDDATMRFLRDPWDARDCLEEVSTGQPSCVSTALCVRGI